MRPTGVAMQMDVWYDAIVQEMSGANSHVSELLEDAEVTLEPEATEEEG